MVAPGVSSSVIIPGNCYYGVLPSVQFLKYRGFNGALKCQAGSYRMADHPFTPEAAL
jgi:hypothetical protein